MAPQSARLANNPFGSHLRGTSTKNVRSGQDPQPEPEDGFDGNDTATTSDSSEEGNANEEDPAYIPEQQDIYHSNPQITPEKRALGSDGKSKRDTNAKKRVITCLQQHGLETHRCSLTNGRSEAVQLEYAHLLPLALDQETVGILKDSMAVTI